MPYKDPAKQREYQQRWRAQRREKWLRENGPCKNCGSWDDLELDHIDESTKVSHNVWSWSKARQETELKKCQVLCHTCHLEKTSRWRASAPIPHGTDSGYTGRGCRCADCTEAHRAQKKAYRARRRAAGLSYT